MLGVGGGSIRVPRWGHLQGRRVDKELEMTRQYGVEVARPLVRALAQSALLANPW